MINNIILVGRLAKDPEVRELEDGKSVCEITLAVSKPFKNAITYQYETDFIPITLWETLAKNVAEYCKKGATVGVKGRLSTRTREIEERKIQVIEVVGEKITFISKKEENEKNI